MFVLWKRFMELMKRKFFIEKNSEELKSNLYQYKREYSR